MLLIVCFSCYSGLNHFFHVRSDSACSLSLQFAENFLLLVLSKLNFRSTCIIVVIEIMLVLFLVTAD